MIEPAPPWAWTPERSYHVEIGYYGEGVSVFCVHWDTEDGVGERFSYHLTTIGMDGVEEWKTGT